MEKYYRVSDVNEIIKKLAREPYYQHDGEDFYTGVCAVEGELMCLDTVELEEPKVGKWLPAGDFHEDFYNCSNCDISVHHELISQIKFCVTCGAKMKKDNSDE